MAWHLGQFGIRSTRTKDKSWSLSKVGQVGLLQMLEGQHEPHEDQPVLGAAHVRLPSQELRPPKIEISLPTVDVVNANVHVASNC